MKKAILIGLLALTSTLFLKASEPLKVTWKTLEYNFGNIPKGVPAKAEFSFTNSDKTAVTITNAQGSCGCTVTDFEKGPIAPGKTGSIHATYNAASMGVFTKTVTVSLSDGTSQVLTFKGTVVEAAKPVATPSKQ